MLDVMILASYIVKDGEKKLFYNKFDVEKLQEIMLESRPSFPSDKITLNIAEIIKRRHIRYLTFIFNCTDKFGLETVFEDSQRNSMYFPPINSTNECMGNKYIFFFFHECHIKA